MAVFLGWCRAGARGLVLAIAMPMLACGGGDAAPAAEPVPEPEPAAPAHGPYALHEWGLIAASTASPTQRSVTAALTVGNRFGALMGEGGTGLEMGAIGKPVLYFHLDDGTEALELSVGVRATGGQVVEHFPVGVLSEESAALRWPSVRVTRGACRGTYPALTDPACHTPDQLCEAAELSAYESATADCVQVGEQRGGVLLYRTGPSTAGLPLSVSVDDVGQVSVGRAAGVADGAALPAGGWVMRITRGDNRALTRVQIVTLAADGSATIPPAAEGAAEGDAGHAHLRDALTAAGLDDAERDAFLVAWSEALFGEAPPEPGSLGGLGTLQAPGGSAIPPGGAGYAPPELRGTRHGIGMREAGLVGDFGGGGLGFQHALGSVADALVFLVPQASVDTLLPLDLQPAPREVRRVFLARVEVVPQRVNLTVALVSVRGSLDAEAARRVIRRNVMPLSRCLSTTGPTGNLIVELRILTTGAVERATVTGLALDPEQNTCLLERLRSMTFPASDSVTELTAPITVRR